MAVSIVDRLRSAVGIPPRQPERADPAVNFADYVGYFGSFNYGGMGYPFITGGQALGGKQEVPQQSFEGYIQAVYKTNGVIFSCMLVRMMLFSEARFQFRRMVKGRPGELFGTKELDVLDRPWTNATTGDLLARVIQDADIAGNFYGVRRGNKIRRLRPDWVTIVIGSQEKPENPSFAPDAEVVGYLYHPGGPGSNDAPEVLLPEEVAHFSPIPDPLFRFRGMSWITPVIREVMGDAAATTHKLKFFENGATPHLAVSLDPKITKDVYDAFVSKMKDQHDGVLNAYKTLYLGGGATATVVGANMRQMDFKLTQGAGETRIASAAGVPPIIVGLSEGLAAATYSNYGQAREHFASATLRPMWRNAAGSFEHLLNVPAGAELWYDDRDIPFLKADVKDAATATQTRALSIRTLVDAGFEPDSVIDAIEAHDLTRLKHTGLYSVQLQTPGSLKMPEQPPIIPGEPIYPELPAPSNKPGETGGPKALSAGPPAPILPAPAKKVAASLTAREQEIAALVGQGMTNRAIADQLVIGERTVETHVASILRKSGVHSRAEISDGPSSGESEGMLALAKTIEDRGTANDAALRELVTAMAARPIEIIMPAAPLIEKLVERDVNGQIVKTTERPIAAGRKS